MKGEELNYNEIDEVIRNAADRIPTGKSESGWEELALQLEQSAANNGLGRKGLFKGFSLNTLIFGGLILVVLTGGYILTTTGTQLESVSYENNTPGLQKENFSRLDMAPRTSFSENSTALWKVGDDRFQVEQIVDKSISDSVDTTLVIKTTQELEEHSKDTVKSNNPYIFW